MTMLQVEDFRQHGYVVIDNFISKEAAARIKAEALRLRQRGMRGGQPTAHGLLVGLCGMHAAPALEHGQVQFLWSDRMLKLVVML